MSSSAKRNASLRPVHRKPIYEQVSDQLREFIDINQLQPGDRLMTERELAQQLSVGRSSIREAITALRAQGIVEVRHGEGIYLMRRPEDLISSLAVELIETHADHPYIWETRQALETQCARLAASRATPTDKAEIEAGLALMADEIADGKPGLEGDRRFHMGVAAAAHNPVLIELLQGIRGSLDRTSETSLTRTGQPEQSLRDHRIIFDAIVAGDPDEAAHEMLRHLVSTCDGLLEEPQPAARTRRAPMGTKSGT